MWHVGQEVVCIAKSPPFIFMVCGFNVPQKDHVYVIDEIVPNPECSTGTVAFGFAEFGPKMYFCECGFRPVHKNDISELRELLNNLPKSVDDKPAKKVKVKEKT